MWSEEIMRYLFEDNPFNKRIRKALWNLTTRLIQVCYVLPFVFQTIVDREKLNDDSIGLGRLVSKA